MRSRQREDREEGQAIVLVVLAMGIFLIGAVGLGFDGSILYAQLRRAQLAADAAAQAAMLSIYDGTNTVSTNSAKFSTGSSFTCATGDARTPCKYAGLDGFNTSADTITVDFPTSAPGVTLSTVYPTNLVKVTVSRSVSATLMRLLGSTSTTITATATAAIVDVNSPVPILVLHPHWTSKTTSFLTLQGTPDIKICGGPSRSIQVDSDSPTAASTGGSASIDLSHAGPLDLLGDCTTGTGADLGSWGGPSTSPSVNYGTKPGNYVQPASPMKDPLRDVSAPPMPANSGNMGTHPALANGVGGCPASPGKPCQLYYPGLYPSGINGDNSTMVISPGIYYIQNNGFVCHNNCDIYMATGITDSGPNTTGTGWDGTQLGGGALFYNTGSGQFQITANSTATLIGSPSGSIYKGILFFEDHAAAANNSEQSPKTPQKLGGGGTMTLIGTLYFTNHPDGATIPYTQYQELDLSGGSGSGTTVEGEIIVDSLQMGGNGSITMNLNSNASYIVSEVALVQ